MRARARLTLTTDGERRTVIGIMPPRFTIAGQHADFLMPYGLTTEQLDLSIVAFAFVGGMRTAPADVLRAN